MNYEHNLFFFICRGLQTKKLENIKDIKLLLVLLQMPVKK